MSWSRRWSALAIAAVLVGATAQAAAAERPADSGITTSGHEVFVTVTGAPIASVTTASVAVVRTMCILL